jgi:uncharacterized membrane protein YccC
MNRMTNPTSYRPTGHTGIDFPSPEGRHFKAAKNGMTAIALAYLAVMLILTGLSIWLALAVSPWFFIGTVIAGGYSLVLTVVVIAQRFVMNSVGKGW